MFRIWSTLKSIILWSFERGSWQYDVLVVLILGFVFLTPNSWFESRGDGQSCDPAAIYVDATALGSTEPQATLEGLLTAHLRKTRSGTVQINRLEPKTDPNGQIKGYCVWLRQ